MTSSIFLALSLGIFLGASGAVSIPWLYREARTAYGTWLAARAAQRWAEQHRPAWRDEDWDR